MEAIKVVPLAKLGDAPTDATSAPVSWAPTHWAKAVLSAAMVAGGEAAEADQPAGRSLCWTRTAWSCKVLGGGAVVVVVTRRVVGTVVAAVFPPPPPQLAAISATTAVPASSR